MKTLLKSKGHQVRGLKQITNGRKSTNAHEAKTIKNTMPQVPIRNHRLPGVIVLLLVLA
jgi:hypothetical protein